jgi:hypothetical protein
MPQNDSPPETNEQTDNIQAQAENETSAREAADLEERLTAERIAQARNESDAIGEEMERTTVLGVAAQGREALLDKLREHATKPKEVYTPPAMTDRQKTRLEEEMAAGRAAQAKAQAQLAHRPVPPVDPREGTAGRPVHRPGNVVPDPILMAAGSTPAFVAGTKVFSSKV